MPRTIPKPLLLLALLIAPPRRSEAQNFFVGPGSTAPGDILRGEGVFLMGQAQDRYYSAVAGSINTDTYIRLNEYIYYSMKNMERDRAERVAAYQKTRLENYNKIQDRKLNAPERKDLESGDALNHRLRVLLDPQVFGGSLLQTSPVPLSVDDVRSIPFTFASEGATISIKRLTDTKRWPIGLRGPELDPARRAYERAIDAALEEILAGKLTPVAIAQIQSAIDGLHRALERQFTSKENVDYGYANRHLLALERSKEELRRPKVEQIIGALDRYSGTRVDELIDFMSKNRLQFGVPEIGDELGRYPRIYHKLILQQELVKGNVRAPKAGD